MSYSEEVSDKFGGEDGTLHICYRFDHSNDVCLTFHNLVGFNNLWLGYLIVLGVCLLLSAIYAAIICCKLPHFKILIKWHIGIFLVNSTVWYWTSSLVFSSICHAHLFCSLNALAIPLLIICIILFLLDLYYAPEAKYFRNQKQAEEVTSLLERIKAARPYVGVYIKCFHHEVWGKQSFKTISFRERRLFKFDGYVDVSQTPSRIDGSVVTLLNISKKVGPGDEFSQNSFHQFKNRYIASHQHRDQGMNTSIEIQIPELTAPHMMVFSGRPPWYASSIAFYLLSVLNSSILLRLLLVGRTKVLSLLIQKMYFVDPSVQRTYDFDTGLVGPTVVHNYIVSPDQGHRQAHGYVPSPPEFGQPATVPPPHQTAGYSAPPTYEQHHNFPAMT